MYMYDDDVFILFVQHVQQQLDTHTLQ